MNQLHQDENQGDFTSNIKQLVCIVSMLFLLLPGALCQKNIDVDLKFKPASELETVHMAAKIFVNDKLDTTLILLNYPAAIHYTLPEKSNEVYIEIEVYQPRGYRTIDKKIEYRDDLKSIMVRSVDEIYIMRRNKASTLENQGEYNASLENYNSILNDKIYSNEIQKLQTFRSIIRIYGKLDDDKKVIETYEKAHNSVSFHDISASKVRLFWQERLDAYMKIGGYNQLSMPMQDFPYVVLEEKTPINLVVWYIMIVQFLETYPASGIPDYDIITLEGISDQFMLLKSSLGR